MTDNRSTDNSVPAPSPPPQMTIKIAQDFFNDYSDKLRPDYERLVQLIQDNRLEAPLPNNNYLHALSLTDLMFRRTHCEFCMLTGSMADGFLQCLLKSFQGMLQRVQRNQGEARVLILSGKDEDQNEADLHQMVGQDLRGVLKVKRVTTSSPAELSHFMVCDSSILREEEPHPPLTDESDANSIKAEVYFANRTHSGILKSVFSQLWTKVTSTDQS